MKEADRAPAHRTGLARAAALVAVLLLALPISPAGVASDNVVRVELSRPALYDLTHDANDPAQLVDGRRENGTMWLSRGALGWYSDGRPIELTLRYPMMRTVERVCLHLGQRPSAGALIPQSIDVFGGSERDGGVRWLGAAQLPGPDTSDPETYRDYEACIRFAPTALETAKIVINPRGRYFFVDEITTGSSRDGRSVRAAAASGTAIADPVSFALRRSELTDRVRSAAQPSSPAGKRELAALLTAMAEGGTGLDPAGLDRIVRTLGQWRARDAEAAAGFRLVATDPFAPAAPLDLPAGLADRVILLASGQTEIAAASLVPIDPRGGRFAVEFAIDGAPPGAFTVSLSIPDTVLAADGKTVADALRPVSGPFEVAPGLQRMVWASVRAAANAPGGTFPARLSVRDLTTGSTKSIGWTIRSHPFMPPRMPFASVAWGYPDRQPLARFAERAAQDLLDHGVNIGVLPASLAPWPVAAGGRAQVPDFRAFDRALDTSAKTQRTLLFLGFKGPEGFAVTQRLGTPTAPLGPEWNRRFTTWIAAWAAHLRARGYGPERIAFYPVDEPGNAQERALFIHLAKLIRQGAPGFPVYATLRVTDGVDPEFLAAADIIQLDEATFDAAFTRRLVAAGKRVWLYAAEKTGKSADPATVYRALPWRAVAAGLSGAGIWSYTQNGDDGSPWDDLDGSQADRAMVYPDASGWLSSRRWEAWRLGNQDAAVLQAALERATTPAHQARVRQIAAAGVDAQRDPARLIAIRGELLALATPD